METFRCYTLDGDGHIVYGEDVTCDSLQEAVAAGRKIIAACIPSFRACKLEVWQRASLLFADEDSSAAA